MKLSMLLLHRETLLRQTHLANLAFAYRTLGGFAARIARARLAGTVCLKQAAPDAGCYCATLTALEGSQSVIEEHFTDEDIMNLADIIAFTMGAHPLDLEFRLEELPAKFLGSVRRELEKGGVTFDSDAQFVAEFSGP